MTRSDERRQNQPIKESELYSFSVQNLKNLEGKERRSQELERLRDVKSQKRVWLKIFLSCLFMNIVFIAFAVWGGIHNGF